MKLTVVRGSAEIHGPSNTANTEGIGTQQWIKALLQVYREM